MVAIKLRKIGNALGMILPQEALTRMHLAEGDTLFLTEAPDGYRITPYDPGFEKQMSAARRIMKKTAAWFARPRQVTGWQEIRKS